MHRKLPIFLPLLVLFGCVGAKPKADVFWPPPPDTARIHFLRSFQQSEDLDDSSWAKTRRVLLGEMPDPALKSPTGLAISDDGRRIYIADYGAGRVMVADLDRKRLGVFSEDLIGRPFNIALDAEENVYITESVGQPGIAVFKKSGELLRRFGTADGIERPTGIAIDRARHQIYVADGSGQSSQNHRVMVFNDQGKLLRQIGGGAGKPARGSENGQFHFPTYLALSSDGLLFVADTMNFRIQVFDPSGTYVRKFGQAGDGPGAFARIKGLAFDGFDNLYISDGEQSTVQIFTREGQFLMFFGGFQPSLLEYFDVPGGIAIDRTKNHIFVGNEYHARINVYELVNTTAEDSRPKKP